MVSLATLAMGEASTSKIEKRASKAKLMDAILAGKITPSKVVEVDGEYQYFFAPDVRTVVEDLARTGEFASKVSSTPVADFEEFDVAVHGKALAKQREAERDAKQERIQLALKVREVSKMMKDKYDFVYAAKNPKHVPLKKKIKQLHNQGKSATAIVTAVKADVSKLL